MSEKVDTAHGRFTTVSVDGDGWPLPRDDRWHWVEISVDPQARTVTTRVDRAVAKTEGWRDWVGPGAQKLIDAAPREDKPLTPPKRKALPMTPTPEALTPEERSLVEAYGQARFEGMPNTTRAAAAKLLRIHDRQAARIEELEKRAEAHQRDEVLMRANRQGQR